MSLEFDSEVFGVFCFVLKVNSFSRFYTQRASDNLQNNIFINKQCEMYIYIFVRIHLKKKEQN